VSNFKDKKKIFGGLLLSSNHKTQLQALILGFSSTFIYTFILEQVIQHFEY